MNDTALEVQETGQVDTQMMAMMAHLDAEFRPLGVRRPAPQAAGYEIAEKSSAGEPFTVVKVWGRDISPATMVYVDGEVLPTRYISESELEAELPTYVLDDVSDLHQFTISDGPPTILTTREGSRSKIAVINAVPSPATPIVGKPFDLTLKFRRPAQVMVSVIHLEVTFPNGEECAGYFRVSERENKQGSWTMPGFMSASWGPVKVRATLYASNGLTTRETFQFEVVPSNPVQVSVYPRYYGTSWKGAVVYSSATGRYYCYARVVFSNGLNQSVTVTNLVKATVTDGGNEVTSFWFTLDSAITVPPNSSRTIYLYTYYKNSATANIFKNFGDVRIRLNFLTSAGEKSDSAVWVMMGQIKVACNFVGSFSTAERQAVRNLTLGRASSIYEKVDMQITSAPILEIPSSNSDWARFRDIRIDSCKNNSSSSNEADDMRADWSSPASYAKHIDLWFVESFSGASCAASLGGFSPRPGPASKSGSNSGAVIDVKDLNILNSTWGSDVLGVVIAHELGHYLGLPHDSSSNNFMNASVGSNSTNISWSQHNTLDDHDWVQKINP